MIPIQISEGHFEDSFKLILKFPWKKIAKTILKKKNKIGEAQEDFKPYVL